jgi:glycosyltransferase involved in cell wall biosynthesis
MRKVLHVGPHNQRGGIATVMEILAENPPKGWISEIISTSSNSNIFSKLVQWRRAKRKVANSDADIVHIHSAADWSFRRKISIAKTANAPVIFHIHSGNFNIKCKEKLSNYLVVVLSDTWRERLEPYVGESVVVSNPVDPKIQYSENRGDFALLLGRNDPVKGHNFAYSLGLDRLVVTGTDSAPEGIEALGWVSEEKKFALLSKAKVLLVPSKYEGQPMVVLEALASGCPVIASDSLVDLPTCVIQHPLNDPASWVSSISKPHSIDFRPYLMLHQIHEINQKWVGHYDSMIRTNSVTDDSHEQKSSA